MFSPEELAWAYFELKLTFPGVMLCGSFGIHVLGYELDRPCKDLDVLIPTEELDRLPPEGFAYLCTPRFPAINEHQRSHMTDFNGTMFINGVPVDYTKSTTNLTEGVHKVFNGVNIKVQRIEDIVAIKSRWSQRSPRTASGRKHYMDLRKLSNQGVIVDPIIDRIFSPIMYPWDELPF